MGGNEWWVAVLKLLSDFQYWSAGLTGAVVATRYNKEQLKTPKEFGGELLVLAQCKQIILKTRDNGIRQMMKYGFGVQELANIFNVTERVVSRVYGTELSNQ